MAEIILHCIKMCSIVQKIPIKHQSETKQPFNNEMCILDCFRASVPDMIMTD